MGFRSPQHIQESRVHFSRALPARYVPPSGFGCPHGGLLPAVPRRFCFTPAALLGFTLRSFLLSEGIQPVSGWKAPPTVSPDGIPHTEVGGRLDRPQFLGFSPSGSPWRSNVCLAHKPLDAPLGFILPGYRYGHLDPDFARSPLTRFSNPAFAGIAAPQSFDRHPPRPAIRMGRPHGLTKATLLGFSHRPSS
jgi:hypothetical protein